MRLLITQDNIVINAVIVPDNWTGKTGEWKPDVNHVVITSDIGSIGDTVVKGNFVPPTPLPEVKDDLTILKEALITKGVITKNDIDAVATVAVADVGVTLDAKVVK